MGEWVKNEAEAFYDEYHILFSNETGRFEIETPHDFHIFESLSYTEANKLRDALSLYMMSLMEGRTRDEQSIVRGS